MNGPHTQVLVVDVHEIERGDQLIGLRTPVDHILYDGNVGDWLLVDHRGTVFARRPAGCRVQVLRGGLSSHDTPPHGLRRHMWPVR